MNIELIDGMNKKVPFTLAGIKKAVLGPSSIVTLKQYDEVSISFFESLDGDEIDVYDPTSIHNPQTVYLPNEIDEAIKEFMGLCLREVEVSS